jgi:hypothetical protein
VKRQAMIEREIEGREGRKRKRHAQRASPPDVSQTSVPFSYVRLDDATVSRSLFPTCLHNAI